MGSLVLGLFLELFTAGKITEATVQQEAFEPKICITILRQKLDKFRSYFMLQFKIFYFRNGYGEFCSFPPTNPTNE
jgi:hypothetical protein